jgi:hypothetical protein
MARSIDESQGFLKVGDLPNTSLDPSQKAVLNRRGNERFNAGDVETARRIYQTTGYSDGLSRVGDHYFGKGRYVDALKMYILANNDRKRAEIIRRMAEVIHNLIREEEQE